MIVSSLFRYGSGGVRSMDKVLIVAYFFPPLGGVAAIRSVKYVKYLREHGIEPVVLTVDHRWTRQPRDHELLGEIPADISVYRAMILDFDWIFKVMYGFKLMGLVKWLRQHVFYPEAERTWLPFAKNKIKRIMKEHQDIKALFITANPFSALSIGLYVKSRYNIPYICEFRDQWVGNPFRLNGDYPVRILRIEVAWKKRILSSSAAWVCLTDLMYADTVHRFPTIKEKPYRIIPNGFDESDFPPMPVHRYTKKMHIVYLGSFYDRRQPDILWRAIQHLVEKNEVTPEELAIDIVGRNTPRFVMGMYYRHPVISPMVNFTPFQSHRHSIESMINADVLLLFIAGGVHTESILTGKVFEYIRSGRPILAIVPSNGLAADIIRNSKTGFIADSGDLDGICEQLSYVCQLWREAKLEVNSDMEYIAQFSRKKNTEILSGLLHAVMDKNTDPHDT